MENDLKTLLDTEVNPVLANHKGGCELVSIDEKQGIAKVKLTGSCGSCAHKKTTFSKMITPFLIENITGLKEVILV